MFGGIAGELNMYFRGEDLAILKVKFRKKIGILGACVIETGHEVVQA